MKTFTIHPAQAHDGAQWYPMVEGLSEAGWNFHGGRNLGVTSKMAMRGGFWSHDLSNVWNVKDKTCNLSQANPMASTSLFYKYLHSCLSAMSYFTLENPTWLSSSSLPIDPVRNPLGTGPSPLWPSLIQVGFLDRARADSVHLRVLGWAGVFFPKDSSYLERIRKMSWRWALVEGAEDAYPLNAIQYRESGLGTSGPSEHWSLEGSNNLVFSQLCWKGRACPAEGAPECSLLPFWNQNLDMLPCVPYNPGRNYSPLSRW